jgi:hypothetical protein
VHYCKVAPGSVEIRPLYTEEISQEGHHKEYPMPEVVTSWSSLLKMLHISEAQALELQLMS